MSQPSRVVAARRRRFALLVVVVATVAVGWSVLEGAVHRLTLPLRDASVIRAQAQAKHVDPALVAAVIFAETKFNPRPSAAGAQGLMQILPGTAEFLARRSGATSFTVADLATPRVNIAYGTYYLRYLLDRYAGNEMLALAAYNGGESNVDRWLASARLRGEPLTVADIPFPETRAYVVRVERAKRDYRASYARELGV